MDQIIRIEELKQWVKIFCDERGWDAPHTAKDCAIGVVTEGAELLEIFRFIQPEQEAATLVHKREDIGDELADTLYFLLRFADRFDFDLSQCLKNKLIKNADRYPALQK
jgi:NTP pyrophosphatase (non-canonical NTP hydrolase)